MPFKKGHVSPNKGKKGGNFGRKSAVKEQSNADLAKAAWINPINKEALLAKIKGGVYSVWDMYYFKALIGDERILSKFGDKLLPDKIDISGDLNAYLTPDEVAEAMKRLKGTKPF